MDLFAREGFGIPLNFFIFYFLSFPPANLTQSLFFPAMGAAVPGFSRKSQHLSLTFFVFRGIIESNSPVRQEKLLFFCYQAICCPAGGQKTAGAAVSCSMAGAWEHQALHIPDCAERKDDLMPKPAPTLQDVVALARLILHKHYCENDVEPIIALMDEDIVWVGAAEDEYAHGREQVAARFRQFTGQVPPCTLSDEDFQAWMAAPGVYLAAGRVWIATDAATGISLRVHQRVTLLFRWDGEQLRCFHIHISNPYEEMKEGDVGFPLQMARQSCLYLQEQIDLQKEKIARQTALLERLSYHDGLTGVFNRNKYNQLLEQQWDQSLASLGVACFDLNGLKRTNDALGHSAGDVLIQQMASQLEDHFPGQVYRIGGDEFLVLDSSRDRPSFQAAVREVQGRLEGSGVSCSVGTSWRSAPCSLPAQAEEADNRMYWAKRRYYDNLAGSAYRHHPHED